MNEQWKNVIITKICAAVYVAPNTGKHIHKNRPFHGLVLNDDNSVKDYVFDDGCILRTERNSLFYLPKRSSYHVEQQQIGGCYAINFDSEIFDKPFSVHFRNTELLLHNFKAACEAWKAGNNQANLLAMRALYDSIYQAQKELQKQYVSGSHLSLIAPAVQEIEHCFAKSDLSVSHLAKLCGISEVYFRKIFLHHYGVSPKEYLIQKRMAYAKQLLILEEFEISEIAALCGYSEACHFSREFKKRFGHSPKKYFFVRSLHEQTQK